MDTYSYYFAYNFFGKNGEYGSGSCNIARDSRIKSQKDLNGVIGEISSLNGFDKVVVTFFHLFDEP